MATISYTKPDMSPYRKVYQWTPFTAAHTCAPIKIDGAVSSMSVQVAGTFGAATVKLQGSNDGTNYADLKDGAGSAISLTAAGLASVGPLPLYVKPVASGGTGQSLTVTFSAVLLR